MFLRKLIVIVMPLLLLLGLCLIMPVMDRLELFFFLPAAKGVLIGIVLALMLPIAGAARARERFAGWLWVPAAVILLLLTWQFLYSTGMRVPAIDSLGRVDTQTVLLESIFGGFLTTQCLRTMR